MTTSRSESSKATTRGIQIEVRPEFLGCQQTPGGSVWFHAYHVTIANLGESTAQLLTRHWIITNARGEEKHVRGPGVVGEEPRLRPGETFQYTSGCPMDTSLGAMHGSYRMVADDGETFDAEIAPFTLAEPGSLN
jgi:ApaG protein